jgi:outer membrane protein assembly factor BamB
MISTFRRYPIGSRRWSFRLALMMLLAAAVFLCDQPGRAAPPATAASPTEAASGDWPLPRGDAQSTGFAKVTLPKDLAVIWEFKADEAIETTPVISAGRVFVSDVMGQLYALKQSDGKEIWRHNYDTGFLASPAIQDDLLVIGDVAGNLYGIEVASGKERWKQTTDGEINGAAAFYQANVLVTSQDGKLYCFSAKDGSPVWTYQTDDQIRCNPTIAGNRTFLGGCDGQLHMVDLKTGKAIGQPLALGGPTGSTPSVVGHQAFVPIMDGAVLAFDWNKPELLWRHEDETRPQEYRGSAAVTDQLVIVSSQFKEVDAISIATGKRKWRHTLKRRADASPLIAGDDVWIAASDGRLIRLALQDGSERWQYEIRGSFLAAPAIAGNQLFVADDEGVVRCFGAARGGNEAGRR